VRRREMIFPSFVHAPLATFAIDRKVTRAKSRSMSLFARFLRASARIDVEMLRVAPRSEISF